MAAPPGSCQCDRQFFVWLCLSFQSQVVARFLARPVKINGQGPYTFVLDTGATFTCIDQKLANELKLPEWQGLGVGVIGPTGGNIRLVTLDTLEVGTVKASDLKACTIDFKQMNSAGLDAQGLVGLNFLKSFRMSIDFKSKLLKLEKE